MLSKQGIFNCDEITIGLLPGLPQICMIYIYIQCVCTVINNRRTCAARVTVVVLCVCLCVRFLYFAFLRF